MTFFTGPARRFLPGYILLGSIYLSSPVWAQDDVFVPLPPSPVTPIQPIGTTTVPDPVVSFPAPDTPFQLGDFVLRPHLLYRFLYGDGIQVRPGQKTDTAINSFSPGFLLNGGSHWTLDYTPTWNLYSNHAFHDTVGENATLASIYSSRIWTLQFSQGYVFSSQPLVETGRQTTVEDFNTSVDISVRLSQKVTIETINSQDLRYSVGFPNTKEWSSLEWLHYQLIPHLDTALGGSVGFIGVSEGTDILYTRPEGQIAWTSPSKLNLVLNGGLDHREFQERPRRSLNTPIYSLTAQYAPVESTTLALSAGHQVSQSYFVNQSERNAQYTATVEQRLLQHYLLTLGVGEHDYDYLSNLGANSALRHDRDLSFDARLSWHFLRRGYFTVLYEWNRNASSVMDYEFLSHQIGFELGYRY